MKRITTLTESRRLVYMPLLCLLLYISASSFSNAQSRDRSKPTPLTSNEISGDIDGDSRGNTYYYSFMAGPGEVSITLTIEPGRNRGSEGFGLKSVVFTLFDQNAETLASVTGGAMDGGDPTQFKERVEVTRRQLITLGVKIPGGNYANHGVGKYRLRISGAVHIGQNTGSLDETLARALAGDIDNPECLPKKGILRIKMKDGSTRRIDLSQAEEITVVP